MTLPSRGPRVEIPLRKPPTLDQVKAAVGGEALEIVAGFDTIEHEGTVVRCVAFHDNGSKARNRHLLIATQQSCGMPPWYARVIRDCSSQVARSRTICAGKLPWCWETPNSGRRQNEPRAGRARDPRTARPTRGQLSDTSPPSDVSGGPGKFPSRKRSATQRSA